MSNNTNENQAGFTVEAVYPFVNKITSLDDSVTITEPKKSAALPADLSINLKIDESLDEVLEYALAVEDPENPETLAKYLKLKKTKTESGEEQDPEPGVLCVHDGKMQILAYPEVPAVLVVNKEGKPEWLEVPVYPNGDDYALGTCNGDWYWYHIEGCSN